MNKQRWLSVLLLAFLGLAVYSNTFFSSFHFDDESSVFDNFAITNIRHLGNIWNFWPTRFLTYFSLAFNYHFHGLDVLGYHIFNLAVHLGSALLVWWLVSLTFSTPTMRKEKSARHTRLIAFFAGAVFVAHPIQTQAVTYITQRAASLATFFYLVSLCFYVKSRLLQNEKTVSTPAMFCYGGSLITAVAAMFTKEMAITLSLMVGLYEVGFLKTQRRFNGRRLIPFFFILLIVPLVMLLTKSVNAGEMRRMVEDAPNIVPMRYFLTQLKVIATYIRLLLVPLNQNIDYDYVVADNLLELPVLAGLFLIMGAIAAAVRLFHNHRLVSFGIFWFFLSLLPESSVVPIRDVIFEHRLYLPMAGFSLFLTGGVHDLFGKNKMVVILFMFVASCSVLTFTRNAVWKDEITLWNDTLRKSPQKAEPYLYRGMAYHKKGDFDKALADYNKALELNPRYAQAYNSRGMLYRGQGRFDQAIADYNKVVEWEPGNALAYGKRWSVYAQKGDFDRAFADLNKALAIDPNLAGVYDNRAKAYFETRAYDKSWEDVDKAEALGYEVQPGFLKALKKASGRQGP